MSQDSDRSKHLSELQIAAALVPGAAQPSCPVSGCTSCAAKLEEAKATAARFHDEVLPRTLAAIVREPDMTPHKKRVAPRGFFPTLFASLFRPPALAAIALAVVAIVLWVKWPRPEPLILVEDERDAGEPYLGVKGPSDDAVRAYLSRGGEVSPLVDGDEVHPGDLLRVTVDGSRGKHALVVSIDGAQQVSVYFPFGGEASQALGSNEGNVELPGAIELDATLGDERLWFLLSEAPLPLAAVRPALDRLAASGAAAITAATATALTSGVAGVHAETMLLHKRAAP